MPITIDGDGTITGVSVGGLPDGIVDADMIASNAVTTAKISNSQITEAKLASDPQKGLAKAWVNLNGTVSSNFIRDSYNVASVTDEATAGHYTVTFTNNMSSTDYCVVATSNMSQAYSGDVIVISQTTSTYKLKNYYGSSHAGTDTSVVMSVVFGN